MLRILSGVAIRRPILVIVVWLAVVAVGYGVGTGVFDRLTSQVGAVPGSESERANALLAAADPEPDHLTAIVTGRSADDAALVSAVADVRALPGVGAVAGPLLSADGAALMYDITLKPGGVARPVADRLHAVSRTGVIVAGGGLTDHEFGAQAQSDVQRAETLTLPIVLVLLVLVFGGLLAASMPLAIAVVAVGGTFGLLYAFSFATDVSVYAIQVATMLSVGLAVDYGLLLINRFREEKAVGGDALERTMRTAGRTVLFTGLTVAVCLAGLTVFPDAFLRSMGLAGAGVVVVDMLAALTLLPALLAKWGRRISPTRASTESGVFAKVARLVQRRAGLVAVLAAGVMVLLAAPALHLRLSNSDARALPEQTQTRQLYDALVAHYPDRVGPAPIGVVVRDGQDVTALRAAITALPGVSTVEERSVPGLTVLRVTPTDRAASDASAAAVAGIRALPGDLLVTGEAAHLADYKGMLVSYGPWAALVVVLGTLVLLFLFTGSVLLPVKAVLTSALSLGAAYGAVVWAFQDGHLAGLLGTQRMDGIDLTVPVLVAAIAFGLSVDYEVFLLSRIRERWLAGATPDQAVAEGLQRSGRIVTSAAALLVVVFAGFLVAGFAPIKELGLGLVLAVALDATVVRMLLVPATMTLARAYNWWAPRPLRRLALTD
jgi:putative drug exporter of the RND superfamily